MADQFARNIATGDVQPLGFDNGKVEEGSESQNEMRYGSRKLEGVRECEGLNDVQNCGYFTP